MDFESKENIIDLNRQIGIESMEIILEVLLTGVLTFLMATTGQVIRLIVNPLGNTFEFLSPLSQYKGELSYMVWGYGSVQDVTNRFGQVFGIYDPDDSAGKRDIIDPTGQFAVECVRLTTEVLMLGVLTFLIEAVGQAIMRIVNPIGNAFPDTPLGVLSLYNGETNYVEWGYGDVLRVTNTIGQILGIRESTDAAGRTFTNDPITQMEQLGMEYKKVTYQVILTGVLELLLHGTGQIIKMIVNPIGNAFPDTELGILSVYNGEIANMYWGYGSVQKVTNAFGEILGIYNPSIS